MSKPPTTRYVHDCDDCQPLGQFKEYDIYFCHECGHPTVVARYGDEGSEYTSGLHVSIDPVLVVARAMALGAGLITEREE